MRTHLRHIQRLQILLPQPIQQLLRRLRHLHILLSSSSSSSNITTLLPNTQQHRPFRALITAQHLILCLSGMSFLEHMSKNNLHIRNTPSPLAQDNRFRILNLRDLPPLSDIFPPSSLFHPRRKRERKGRTSTRLRRNNHLPLTYTPQPHQRINAPLYALNHPHPSLPDNPHR